MERMLKEGLRKGVRMEKSELLISKPNRKEGGKAKKERNTQ